MYNKIASLILNSSKFNGICDVFVAQPDSLKETLAGKIFVLAEIGGKKNDCRKILDFLITDLNNSYYNDEKILLRDKIEGLKIENIFEAALAKTNKALSEFLLEEKIKINPAITNLTVGVIYENKLHFSSFGKNRALLVYYHNERYELINVEANAAEQNSEKSVLEAASAKTPMLFSSVISGEIPSNSYFIFTSEALPEYLSGQDMINIITKLPPIVATEQIKNVLIKINTYVPFLGIVIKNTSGLSQFEVKENLEEVLSANSSITGLNHTEQKTEQMLAPAGLINFSRAFKSIKKTVKDIYPRTKNSGKKVYKKEAKEDDKPLPLDLGLGKINRLNIPRPESFLINEKVFFKKKANWFFVGLKNLLVSLPRLINPRFWVAIISNLKNWLKTLNGKNRLLFVGTGIFVVIFIISLFFTNWNRARQQENTNFNNLVTQIEDRSALVDQRLLYDNESGAREMLNEAQGLLATLPHEKKSQLAVYNRLETKLKELEQKTQKIVKIDQLTTVNDLSGLGINNLIFFEGKIYGASDKVVYTLTPNSASSTKTEVSTTISLKRPQLDLKNNLIYYWGDKQIVKYDFKANKVNLINISSSTDLASSPANFSIFNSNLYLLNQQENQINLYKNERNGFSSKGAWLKETVDLGQTVDLIIDGSIYVLKNDGTILKFYLNKKVDFASNSLNPPLSSVQKFIIGTKYIYIFDASAKRLVVLSLVDTGNKKAGYLVNQYQVDSLVAPKDFTVDEAGKVAYFLDGEVIRQINLNQ